MNKLLRNIKLTAALVSLLSLGLAPAIAHAAGTATYSLAQNGNSVSIYENSGSQIVNTVDAELAYGGSQPVSVSTAGSPFSSCLSSTAASIQCFLPDNSVTGSQLVATLNFSAGASTQVSLSQSSMIVSATSPPADIWDHAAVSGGYSFAAPAAPAPVASSTTSNNSAPAATPASTPAPKPVVKAAATKKSAGSITVSSTAANKTSYTTLYIVLFVALAASVAYEARRRMVVSKEAALASTYKVPATKAKKSSAKTQKSQAAATSKRASTTKKTPTKKTSKK